MKPEQMTEALEQAATQLGVQVRYDTMTGDAAGGGGLCKVKGAWCVIIDRKMPPAERAAMLIEALAGFDTDAVFLPPQVRDAIAAKRSERPPAPREAPPTRPPSAAEPCGRRDRARAGQRPASVLIFSLSSGSSATALSSAARTRLAHGGRRVRTELLVDDAFDHAVERGLGVDPTGGQLGRDVGRVRPRAAAAAAAPPGPPAGLAASGAPSLSAKPRPADARRAFALRVVDSVRRPEDRYPGR